MSKSSSKFFLKLFFQIVGMVAALMIVLFVGMKVKGQLPPEVQGPLVDLFLIPIAVVLIAGLFIVSFLKIVWKENKSEIIDRIFNR